jgi:hypothetical protein
LSARLADALGGRLVQPEAQASSSTLTREVAETEIIWFLGLLSTVVQLSGDENIYRPDRRRSGPTLTISTGRESR